MCSRMLLVGPFAGLKGQARKKIPICDTLCKMHRRSVGILVDWVELRVLTGNQTNLKSGYDGIFRHLFHDAAVTIFGFPPGQISVALQSPLSPNRYMFAFNIVGLCRCRACTIFQKTKLYCAGKYRRLTNILCSPPHGQHTPALRLVSLFISISRFVNPIIGVFKKT
jgi:hypothetical protein